MHSKLQHSMMSTLPSNVTLLPRNDPDSLALLARGLQCANEVAIRRTTPRPSSQLIIDRQYRIIDSLAYALLSSRAKQVVAVGVVLKPPIKGPGLCGGAPTDSPSSPEYMVQATDLLIAENSFVPESTKQHAEAILQYLRSAKKKCTASLRLH